MSDTSLRKICMLGLIPRHPGKIGVSELLRRLEEQNFKVSRRTVQRDLNNLSTKFSLQSDDNNDGQGWWWSEGAPVVDLPAMDPSMALTFKLAQRYLKDILPITTVERLNSYFHAAEDILADSDSGEWEKKIYRLSRTQPLNAPDIDDALSATIYLALLHDQRLDLTYQRRGGEPKSYDVSPLGLVFVDHITYLVCRIRDYEDIRHLALHRVVAAAKLDEKVDSKGFDLQVYVKGGKFEYPDAGDCQIELKFQMDSGVARHLEESPLSDDQVVINVDSATSEITATVASTLQLRWWLMSFGDQVEVLEPAELREEMARNAAGLAERYGRQD